MVLTSLMPSLMLNAHERCRPYSPVVGAGGFFAALFAGTGLAAAGFGAEAVFASAGFEAGAFVVGEAFLAILGFGGPAVPVAGFGDAVSEGFFRGAGMPYI